MNVPVRIGESRFEIPPTPHGPSGIMALIQWIDDVEELRELLVDFWAEAVRVSLHINRHGRRIEGRLHLSTDFSVDFVVAVVDLPVPAEQLQEERAR